MSSYQHPHKWRAAKLNRLHDAIGVDGARLAIIRLADQRGTDAFTVDDAAHELGLSYRTAHRAVRALHAAGVLLDTEGTQPGETAPGKTRLYILDAKGRQRLLTEIRAAITHRHR